MPHLLNVSGQTRPVLVEGHWLRQAQPTSPRFIEKIPYAYKKTTRSPRQMLGAKVIREQGVKGGLAHITLGIP